MPDPRDQARDAGETAASSREVADEELVRRARDGSRAAFEALYARYAPSVHGVLIARIPPQEVQDLSQDVFATALERIGGLDRAAAIGPWLLAIARNRARDAWKSVRRSAESHDLERVEPSAPDMDVLATNEHAERVLACVRALPETYREPLVLRLVEGLSGAAIARATGLTEGSVRVNLCRGMRLLRERLLEAGLYEASS